MPVLTGQPKIAILGRYLLCCAQLLHPGTDAKRFPYAGIISASRIVIPQPGRRGPQGYSRAYCLIYRTVHTVLPMMGHLDDVALKGLAVKRQQPLTAFHAKIAQKKRAYAAALYPDVAQLPEIPQPIAQRISYNAASDCYDLARGDEGLSQINVSQGADPNTLTGTMTSLEDGSVLLSFEVQVSPRDSMFGYIITNLTISE